VSVEEVGAEATAGEVDVETEVEETLIGAVLDVRDRQ
jgi:hypothetical protein